MYIEITPTKNIVTFRVHTDGPMGYNIDFNYQDDPDYQSAVIDFTELKQDLVVTVKYENGVWTADHTYEQIAYAISQGVLVRLTDETNDRYAIVGGYGDDHYIFVTNDTDYCYAYIVTDDDAWNMEEVLEGEDGVGIASVAYDPATYSLTITLTNGDSYTTGSLRGPQGEQGEQGPAGQDGHDGADGAAATIAVGNVSASTGAPGTSASAAVSNSGTSSAAVFDFSFSIPKGEKGDTGNTGATGPQGPAATVSVGSVSASTGLPGTSAIASVTNVGTSTSATFNFGFTIPSGATGQQGPAGTMAIGSVSTSTGAAGTSASVSVANSGTSSAAVLDFDFTIPKGDKGDTGAAGPGVPSGGTSGQILEKVDGTDYNTQWAAKPTSRMYIGTCATAAATVKKVVSVDTFPTDGNGKPLVGTMIGVKFTNSNSATAPTLNVNSTGDISIYYNNAAATSTSAIYGGYANRYNFYIYDGTYWVWMSYGTDANDNTIGYTIRTNGLRKTVSGACYRYRILFNSANGAQWVPANTSSSTNATSARTVNQTKIDPFGPIVYYSSTTALSSGGAPGAFALMEQYNGITLGYSFNRTGAALTLTSQKPVYIKCAPQTDGSAIIDADNPYVQDLPTTADGKIYILLGVATSGTAIEMIFTHPVYYHDGTALRIWTGRDTYVKPSTGIPKTDLAQGVQDVIEYALIAPGGYDETYFTINAEEELSIKNGVIPAAVTANPTVPSGTTPTSLTGLKIGNSYYDIEAGGGTVTDVTVGGTSVVSGGVAVIPAIPSEIDTVAVTVDNNTGTPSATGSVSGTTLSLAFSNLKGENGSSGVGIASVTQTTESTDPGGTNVITVTNTNGTSSTFNVRNGDAVGSVTVVQTTGSSTTAAMSQDATTREISDSKAHTVKVSPNSVFELLNKNGALQSLRVFSFADIKNATAIIRTVRQENFLTINFYAMGAVLGFYQSANTYLVAFISGYDLKVQQYINGTAAHNETIGTISTLGLNGYGDFAVSYDNTSRMFRFYSYDTVNKVVTKVAQYDVSAWNLSSLVDVTLAASVNSYGTAVCNTSVFVNSPSLLDKYIAAPLTFGLYNSPAGSPYNEELMLEGTGLTLGGTIVSTISPTDKIVSVSFGSLSYLALGPSNLDNKYGWHHERLAFSSVGTGAYIQVGVQYKRIVVECEGLPVWDTVPDNSTKFYPEAGKTYDLYYQFGPGQTQTYQVNYGIRAYGDMTYEVTNPYLFNINAQNICAETYDGSQFAGAIPFTGSVEFLEYSGDYAYSIANLRTPIGTIDTDPSGNLWMWNGTVWKRINNS